MNKLFITDLDGTLLNERRQVSSYSNMILNQFDNVGIATGRNIFSVFKIIKEVEINSHIILCNGACVFNKDLDSFESIIPLDQDTYPLLEEIIENSKTKPIIIGFANNQPYFEYKFNHNIQYDKFLSYAKAYPSVLTPKVNEYSFDQTIVEIIFYEKKEEILRIKNEIESKLPGRFMFECRHSIMVDDESFWFLAVFDKSVGKGQAIIDMAERYNVDLKNVYVFGDGLNDVDMFKLPVNKIAVKNTVDEILALADVIIDENTKDSVVNFIIEKNR